MFLNNFLTILKNISNLENPHHNHVHQHYHQIPSIDDDDDDSDDDDDDADDDDDDAISYRFALAVECSCAPKFAPTLPQKYLTFFKEIFDKLFRNFKKYLTRSTFFLGTK